MTRYSILLRGSKLQERSNVHAPFCNVSRYATAKLLIDSVYADTKGGTIKLASLACLPIFTAYLRGQPVLGDTGYTLSCLQTGPPMLRTPPSPRHFILPRNLDEIPLFPLFIARTFLHCPQFHPPILPRFSDRPLSIPPLLIFVQIEKNSFAKVLQKHRKYRAKRLFIRNRRNRRIVYSTLTCDNNHCMRDTWVDVLSMRILDSHASQVSR